MKIRSAVRGQRTMALALATALTAACVSSSTTTTSTEKPTAPAAPATTQKPATPATAGAAAAPAAGTAGAAAKITTITAADGTKIAYDVSGTGPALLLLHGGGQTRKSWDERGYVARLTKKFTVIRMDLRGSGDSGRPDSIAAYALDTVLADVLAVADAAGAKRFHVWGFGHGASLGRYLAARSDRVISAVLVGMDMGPTLSGPVKDAITAMRAKWQPVLEAQKAGKLDIKTLSIGDRDAWDHGVALTAVQLGAMLDYPPVAPADIKVPTLWLIGAADASGMENVKQFEGKLGGTKVTFKQLSGLSYTDSFARIDPVLAEAEPFLASTAAPPS
jgi:pimeloyl-ACP methyl ester carboxylesterase